MISHKHKCIFIHIPKCAGTSIEKALGHFEDYSGKKPQDHRSIRRIEPVNVRAITSNENAIELLKRLWLKIKKPENPRNRYTVSKEQYENYFKFTIIRNPWARTYSWYKNILYDELHRKKYNIPDEISLYDFLKLHIGRNSLRPQTFWIKNFKGDIPLDFIGRFENLANDFETICNRMNIAPIQLPHVLNRPGGSYLENVDNKSKELIRFVFKEEIELFGYSFES